MLAIRVPLSRFISLSMPLPRLVRECVRECVRVRVRVRACVRACVRARVCVCACVFVCVLIHQAKYINALCIFFFM